jgi:hypothetical protein
VPPSRLRQRVGSCPDVSSVKRFGGPLRGPRAFDRRQGMGAGGGPEQAEPVEPRRARILPLGLDSFRGQRHFLAPVPCSNPSWGLR